MKLFWLIISVIFFLVSVYFLIKTLSISFKNPDALIDCQKMQFVDCDSCAIGISSSLVIIFGILGVISFVKCII